MSDPRYAPSSLAIDPPPAAASQTAAPALRRVRGVLLVVALFGIAVQGVQVLASRPVILPDSRQYILLGIRILEHGDFGHELFQFRPPGYPVMLAGVFGLCGPASGTAILALQHGMVVATACLASLTAWYLTERRTVALVAGLLAAAALHVSGMANAILTETPYTLALTGCVVLLVRGMRYASLRSIALASLVAGFGTIIKPTGQIMVGVCALVAVYVAWRSTTSADRRSLRRRGVAVAGYLAAALMPATVVILPVALNSYRQFGKFQLTAARGYCLYFRAAFVDELDDPQSEALTALKLALEVGKRQGWMREDASYQDFYLTLVAYERVHHVSMSQAFEVMEQAALDLTAKHWPGMVLRTITHSYRTFFEPDYSWRILPGGAPGHDGYMAFDADVISHTTFVPLAESLIGDETLARYLPVQKSGISLTGPWSKFVAWYHRRIETGAPVIGLLDTPYEELTALALIGGVLALFGSNRAAWLLCGVVVAIHVVLSAAMQGALARYALPVHPLLNVFQALVIVGTAEALGKGARQGWVRSSRQRPAVTVQRSATRTGRPVV